MLSRSVVLSELHNWGLVLYYDRASNLGTRNLWSGSGGGDGEYNLDADAAGRVDAFLNRWQELKDFGPKDFQAIRVLKKTFIKSEKEKRTIDDVAKLLGMSRSTVKRRYDRGVEKMQRCYSINETKMPPASSHSKFTASW